jgi:hypothetical protein
MHGLSDLAGLPVVFCAFDLAALAYVQPHLQWV